MGRTWEEEADYQAQKWTPRRTKVWVAIILALLIAAPVIGWGIHVATSGVEGKGDQIVHNNSEENRTGQQQEFEDLYADIQSYKVKIKTAAADVKTNVDPGDLGRLKSVLSGTVNQCASVVQQYNANTHKVLAKDWKDARLPYEIQQTECEEAAA